MIRALLWKEWREQRTVAATGLALAVLLPIIVFAVVLASTPQTDPADVVDVIPFALAAIVWPLFAALAGASTNADEAAGGSLSFLLSRPVSRGRVWFVKVAAGSAALVIIIGGSFAIARLLAWFVGDVGFQFPFSADPLESALLTPAATQVVAVMFPVLALGFASLFATFVRRQLAAALAGGTVAITAIAAGLGWERLITADPRLSYGSESFLLGYLALTTLALFGGALFAFRSGAMLPGAERWRVLGATVAGIVLVVLVGTQALAAVMTRSDDPAVGWLRLATTLPGGDAIVVSSQPTRFAGDSLWLAVPGKPLRRLTDRMAYGPVASPDGEWIVYSSQLGPFGIRREHCTLRAVRPSGTGDHQIVEQASCGQEGVFSQDGTRYAVAATSGLVIAAVGGHPARVLPTPRQYGRPLAWTPDDRGIVWRAPGRPGALYRLDGDTGEAVELFGPGVPVAEGLINVDVPVVSARRLVIEGEYPTRVLDGGERVADVRLYLLELTSGHVEPIPEVCPQWSRTVALIHEGAELLYPACPNSTAGGEIRLRNLDSGSDRIVAAFDGQVSRVVASPAGAAAHVTVRNPDESGEESRYHDVVVGLDGSARRLELPEIPRGARQWRVGRWLDDSHLLLERYVGRRRYAYAKLDPWTNELDIIVGNR